ncbi:MAG: hypothetical protein ACREDO_06820 [Methyloceanibacter sp.]
MKLSFRFAVPLLVALGLFAGAAPASAVTAGTAALAKPETPTDVVDIDYYCGPGWFLYYGRCVPYGSAYYSYGGPSFSWGPTYRHRHYRYDDDHHYKHYKHYKHYGHGGKSHKYYRGKGGKSVKHYGGGGGRQAYRGGKSVKHYGGGGGRHAYRGGKGGGKHISRGGGGGPRYASRGGGGGGKHGGGRGGGGRGGKGR